MEAPTPQYWLVDISSPGVPKLIDGYHETPQGVNQAAYLIRAMGLGDPSRRFAVAKIELSECVPSAEGVNHEAVQTINSMRRVPR
jgi:hypothetical protein